jgi:hypothetical protein
MKPVTAFIGSLLFAASSTAFAIPMSTVGPADTLVDWDQVLPSSSENEANFIASYLGVDPSTVNVSTFSGSGGDDVPSLWQQVDGDPSLWAFDLGFEPALFLIKTSENIGLAGDGLTDTFNMYLFSNSNNWAVIDLDLFEKMVGNGNFDIGIVSHVSVPEPGTLLLFGSSLLGFGLSRRRYWRRA